NTIHLLCQLAEASHLSDKIQQLFKGDSVNYSENRPALHAVLRTLNHNSLTLNGKNIASDVQSALDKMRIFVEKVRNKTWRGATGKPIRHIVNIGIGGSHLGPLMATHALAPFAHPELSCHFISNIDSLHLHQVLNKI